MDQSEIRYRQPTNKQRDLVDSEQRVPKPSNNKKWLIIPSMLISVVIFFYTNSKPMNFFSSTIETSKSLLLPQYNTFVDGTEYIYQFPRDLIEKPQESKGIIFFAHGCSHSATDWFKFSKYCPRCIGLPEERNLIQYFLKQQYIAIVISSQNRFRKCWHPDDDSAPAMQILHAFKTEYNLDALPVFAFGASSGGSFVASLALNDAFIQEVGLKGVIIQISKIPIAFNQLKKTQVDIPLMFIPMERDERTLKFAENQLNMINNEKNVLCVVKPKQITEDYFYTQINDETIMTQEISKRIYDAFKTARYLNEDNYLVDNPRVSDWRKVIKHIPNATKDSFIADQSPISEEMNVAYAQHEITAECNAEMLAFLQDISTIA